MALKVVDRAIQVHGAEGISQDQPLAYFYASLRTLKFADVSHSLLLPPYSPLSPSCAGPLGVRARNDEDRDGRCKLDPPLGIEGMIADEQGPDEVHIQQQGKQELKRVQMIQERNGRIREKSKRLTQDPERMAKL